jgi:hypothetical protein
MTSSTSAAMAPSSLTWARPRSAMICPGSPPCSISTAKTSLPAGPEMAPDSTAETSEPNAAGVIGTSASSRSPSSRGSSLMIQRATAAADAPADTAPSKRSPVGRSPVSRSVSASERPWVEGQAAKRSASTVSRRRASARYSVRLFFGGRVLALATFGWPSSSEAARAAAASSAARPAHESRSVTIRLSTRAPDRESTGSTKK